MSGQYFGERKTTSDIVDANTPVVNSDLFADRVPVDPTLVQDVPMGGTVAAVDPMDESIVREDPIVETLPYKAPYNEPVMDEAKVTEPIPYKLPESEVITRETPVATASATPAALLNHEESEHFRTSWNEIQGKFVDEPRAAVQQADTLVSEVIGQITQMFAKEHSVLEGQWKQGNDVSTEDLRKALQRYRSFFNRLVV